MLSRLTKPRVALCLCLLGSACGARTELTVQDDDGAGAGGGVVQGGGPSGGGGEGGIPNGGGGEGGEGGEGGAPPPECDPATTQFIYLVTDAGALFSYNPATGNTALRGTLDCDSFGATPFSMGVDRRGTAYVVYNDGFLYKVDILDASCEPTDFEVGQEGFTTFGMGFALDEGPKGDPVETLYVAGIDFGQPSRGLAKIDTETLELDFIGEFSTSFSDRIEMTSSSDGNLYGYFLNDQGSGGWVVDINEQTAVIESDTFINAGSGSSSLAFAWWGGDFYVFTGDGANGTTNVTRFDPDSGEVAIIKTFDGIVVGAGVSTCAPGQQP